MILYTCMYVGLARGKSWREKEVYKRLRYCCNHYSYRIYSSHNTMIKYFMLLFSASSYRPYNPKETSPDYDYSILNRSRIHTQTFHSVNINMINTHYESNYDISICIKWQSILSQYYSSTTNKTLILLLVLLIRTKRFYCHFGKLWVTN